MSGSRFRFVAPALAGLLLAPTAASLGGCATNGVWVDRDRRQVMARIEGAEVTYRFGQPPSSWESIRLEDDDAAWHDRATNGVAHVDHECRRAGDVPLTALTQQLLIGFTEREVVREETIPFDGREARHSVIRARLDGVPVTLALYVLKKDGCVFDLGYVAPSDRYAAGEAGFDAFARGFETVGRGPWPDGRPPEDRP